MDPTLPTPSRRRERENAAPRSSEFVDDIARPSRRRREGAARAPERRRDPNAEIPAYRPPGQRSLHGVPVADLDRAAQLAPYRYVDAYEVIPAHHLETEHIRYTSTQPGLRGRPALGAREPRLSVTAYPLSECARFYFEGEGAFYRKATVRTGEFGSYVGQVERALAEYWGPALSAAR